MVSRLMISLRPGPAERWQCLQLMLQAYPTLTCRMAMSVAISGPPRISLTLSSKEAMLVYLVYFVYPVYPVCPVYPVGEWIVPIRTLHVDIFQLTSYSEKNRKTGRTE